MLSRRIPRLQVPRLLSPSPATPCSPTPLPLIPPGKAPSQDPRTTAGLGIRCGPRTWSGNWLAPGLSSRTISGIEELPEIFAAKFRQRLQLVARDIRRLAEERDSLQAQIHRTLAGGEQGAPPPSPRPAAAGPRRRQGRLVVAAAGLAAAGGAALVGALGLRLRPPASPPPPTVAAVKPSRPPAARPVGSQPAAAELRLRARGDCWLEVRRDDGSLVLNTTLRQGQVISVPLRSGVRIRAGRPDLLDLAIPGKPYRVFGQISDLRWQNVLPVHGRPDLS